MPNEIKVEDGDHRRLKIETTDLQNYINFCISFLSF